MYCRGCGEDINTFSPACTACGINPRAGHSFCSACGAKTKAEQILCIECGASPNAAHFAGASQTVNNQMVKAILVTVLCCLPFGIVAIIKSSEVNGKLAVGDIVGAQMSASSSSNWSNMAIIFGLIFGIFYFFILMADILFYL
tara:strand:+ start:2623 stop:3051 length:429 start_codon:yes stop_codon:yes gene_type:complete